MHTMMLEKLPVLSYPGQCCSPGYCIEAYEIHNLPRLEADHKAALIRAALADAWDEGYGDDLTANVPRVNPYRGEAH
jgi:hypothetical protein